MPREGGAGDQAANVNNADDLVVWLRRQFYEDRRIARAAHGGEWDIVWDVLEGGALGSARIGAASVFDPDGGEWQAPDIAKQLSDADAEHIVRWQPTQILADVEAKERIVAYAVRMDYGTDEQEVLRMLASAYAGRVGYLESWRL